MIDRKSAEPDGRMVIRCAACKIALTTPLCRLAAPAALSRTDGEPIIPSGFYCLSPGDYYPAGEWVANLGDLLNTAHHPDPRRHNGCCGRDGCDGINRVCANGHEVGTERSDCWWAHGIHFDPALVVISDA